MKKKRNPMPSRKMKQVFLVFCEGETEEAYISLLRQRYRWSPLKVISRVTGLSISPDIINRHIKAEQIGPADKISVFLMYDVNTDGIIERIAACKNAVSIVSNPAVELWFLLHITEQNAAISVENCIEKLKKVSADWKHYKKGILSERQKEILWVNRGIAAIRSKRLSEEGNPSSLIFRLIEKMDSVTVVSKTIDP